MALGAIMSGKATGKAPRRYMMDPISLGKKSRDGIRETPFVVSSRRRRTQGSNAFLTREEHKRRGAPGQRSRRKGGKITLFGGPRKEGFDAEGRRRNLRTEETSEKTSTGENMTKSQENGSRRLSRYTIEKEFRIAREL